MKKRFLTFIACALCMACACVTLGSCGGDSKFKNWLNELLGKDSSTSSAPADSSTDEPDDSSSTDDGTSDDSSDTSSDDSSTVEPDDSSSSSTPDEPDEPDEPIYNDFAYFDGEVLETLDSENVYNHHQKIVCTVGEAFRLRIDIVEGEIEEVIEIGTSSQMATCDVRGNVTAIAPGFATYAFKINEEYYSSMIIVAEKETAADFAYYNGEGEYILENDIYINPAKATVKVGDTFRLKAVEASGKSLTYKMYGNQEGINVDARGNVTAISAGECMFSVEGASSSQLVTITVIDACEHVEVTDAAVAATCTTSGKTAGSHCSLCNKVFTAQTTIPAPGHTEVTDAAVAATCTTSGKTAGKHCSVCNAVIQAQTTIPAPGHTEVTDAAVAATCTTEGKTAGKHCSVCNTVTVAQTTIPAPGHTEIEIAGKGAWCTTEGLMPGKRCSVCNTVTVAQGTIAALGHNMVSYGEDIAATCTTDGYANRMVCSRCEIYTSDTIPATGHTEVTDAAVAATCTTEGKTAGKHCSVCDEVLTAQETIPATGHEYVDNVCSRCGYTMDGVDYSFVQAGNYTESDIEVGDKVAGNWYRIYRPDGSTLAGHSSFGFNVSGNVEGSGLSVIPFAIYNGPYDSTNGDMSHYIYVTLLDEWYILDNNYIVTEEYIDFYVEEGASIYFYKEYNGNTVTDVTITITAESVIESIGDKANVKRLDKTVE